jgi:hypothetical protein
MNPRLLRPLSRFQAPAPPPIADPTPPIADPTVWLDASDPATLFDATTGGSLASAGGGVGRWEDKSGNGRHFTQATANNRPVRSVALQNGLDAVSFDGLNDFLQGSHGLQAKQPHTVFAAWNINGQGPGTDRSIFLLGNRTSNVAGTMYGLPFTFNSAAYGRRSPFADAAATPSVTLTQTRHNVFAYRISDGGSSLFVDSTARGLSSNYSSLNLASAMEIGRGSVFDSVAHTNLALYEVLVYPSSLSDESVALVRSYLLAKWGLT